jgi:AcrR family transcriptional regulator
MSARVPATDPASAAAAASSLGIEPGRRGEILVAALQVFAEKGYDAGTMRDIARRVGVTEPALYRHFASKEDLFMELLRATAGRMRDEVFGMLDALDPATLRASIISILVDRREALALYGPALRTMIIAAVHNEGFLGAYRVEVVLPLRERLTETAARVDRHLGIDRAPAERAERIRAVMSVAIGTLVTTMVLGDESTESTADAVIRIMGWETV